LIKVSAASFEAMVCQAHAAALKAGERYNSHVL
jgi:hypothetical protein